MRTMQVLSISSALLFLFSVQNAYGLDYSDLEAMDADCPRFDKCRGYRNNLSFLERSCECDSECNSYRDCCIDAPTRDFASQSLPENLICLPYRKDNPQAGVYAIASCSDDWNGSSEVREKCEGPHDFSSPLLFAPMTSIEKNVTYRNRYCAECNNETSLLTLFHTAIFCEGLSDLSEDDIAGNITFDSTLDTWGVHRPNEFSNGTIFVGCQIIFDVPDYLENSTRFCRSNIISTCSSNWTRDSVKNACEKYMAVIFDGPVAYRNAHCAICNHRDLNALSCPKVHSESTATFSYAHLLDLNQRNGDRVDHLCGSNEIYDHSFKKCKPLSCALPGLIERNGRCVQG